MGDLRMKALDLAFYIPPVVTGPGRAAHGLPRLAQRPLMPPEAVLSGAWNVRPRAWRTGPRPYPRRRRSLKGADRIGHFTLSLDGHKPLATRPADSDVLHVARHIPAVAIAQPVEPDLFGVGIAEAVGLPLLAEAGEGGPLRKEISVGPLHVFQRLLQRMDRHIRQPCGPCAVAPRREHRAQPGVPEPLFSGPMSFLLHRQRLVMDAPARASETAHEPLLFTIGPQFNFIGLQATHVK